MTTAPSAFQRLVAALCIVQLAAPLPGAFAQSPLDQSRPQDVFNPSTQPDTSQYTQQYCTAANPCPAPSALGRDVDISPPREQSGRLPGTQNSLGNDQGNEENSTFSSGYGASPYRYTPPPPPTEFQHIVAASTGHMLPIFGASLFSKAPSTFAPVDNIPVTPDYVIGPGDEIRLQIWGQINQHGSFVVDRTGSIALPQIGTIHVAGLQFSQLTDFLRSQLSRVYRNFDLNVNLGQLRSIQVFVVGQARQPGSYTISSLSTLLNALFASGGPLPQGSLRDIQVRRNGQSVTHFDLYDLLLRGDKSKDVRLEPGDVIFIPDVGPQVAVSGSVTTPAVYELRGKTSFAQVLQLAGGLTNTAANSRLRVERIDEHIQRSMVEVALDSAGTTEAHNGDIISVDSILGRFKDAVTLRGNVANPGRYQWHQGMRISDLIPNREMLVTRDYYRRLIALGRPEAQPQISPYNSGFYNPQGPYSTQGPYPAGAGGYPSDTSGYPGAEGSYTSDQSGSSYPNGRQGYSADRQGYPSNDEGGLGIRQNYSPTYPGGQSGQQRTGSSASGGGTSVGAALTDTNANFAPKNDVVLAAPDIDWQYAVIERQSASDLTTSLLPFNLAKAVLDHDTTQDLELLPGDIITIFSKADIRVPSAQQTKFVKLEGEFVAAGVYSVKPGETLRQLVIRAGGLTSDADLFASEFTRDSVRRLQKQRLLEFADALQSQISANSTANTASALTERDAAAVASSASEARTVVARLRSTEPNGRIVLPLKPDASGVGALPDIPLQDNDRFIVPRIPSTVTVEGQVYNPNAFLYLKGRRVKDYLRLAGGPDRVGDRSREFVLRADGSVVSRQYGTFAQHALFSNRDFDDVVLYPGDTIVVPPIIQKSAVLRNLSDISTILEGFGLGAAAIQVLR